jgi:hypothetical protein
MFSSVNTFNSQLTKTTTYLHVPDPIFGGTIPDLAWYELIFSEVKNNYILNSVTKRYDASLNNNIQITTIPTGGIHDSSGGLFITAPGTTLSSMPRVVLPSISVADKGISISFWFNRVWLQTISVMQFLVYVIQPTLYILVYFYMILTVHLILFVNI